MIQYNLNVKLLDSQHAKLKLATKYITLMLPSKVIDTNETNFQHELLLTDGEVPSHCKVLPKNSLANIKSSKTKIRRSGGFLSKPLGPFIING